MISRLLVVDDDVLFTAAAICFLSISGWRYFLSLRLIVPSFDLRVLSSAWFMFIEVARGPNAMGSSSSCGATDENDDDDVLDVLSSSDWASGLKLARGNEYECCNVAENSPPLSGTQRLRPKTSIFSEFRSGNRGLSRRNWSLLN